MNTSSLDGAHVLVVNDHAQNRKLAQTFLEHAGYRVSTAEQGDAAVRAFAQTPADLVLLDVMLPDADGFTTCQRLRQLPAGGQAAIVFVTPVDDPGTQRRALESGADDLVMQPLQRSELLLRVQSVLRTKHLHDEQERASEVIRLQRDELIRLQRQREENIALLVHDMKNPLAGVLSNAEFMVTSGGLDIDQTECANDILHASRRLHRMVMSLLDVSQSEHGVLRPATVPLDLTELVMSVRSQCASKLRDKSLTLTVVLPPDPIPIEADRDMLMRLLANLLDNAMRHAPANTSVGLEVHVDGDAIELRVSDAGPSIPEPERLQIFESYVQLEDRAARLRARRGLGLSSSRAVVEAHGGRIWVEDCAQEGATFCVRLPGPRNLA
jgi:two-component system sensor histidine kinase/response regulator